jgi:hypothetical protein
MARRRLVALVLAVVLLVASLPGAGGAGAQAADWDIPQGHFFTQTAADGESGYAVTDENGVLFWREFKRLGGVQAVGYPISGRFQWNGFTCQAMQRVVFQWRPETGQVAFVNVFDLLAEAGKDDWLLAVRQTPRPGQWQEDGLSWEQVVAQRLAVLDAFPAIKAAYFGVVGDPVTMNGLPMAAVADMGNNYTLRAQRVVIQQWKEDVPWARAGQVTFALGGTIAGEAGLLPAPSALEAERLYANGEKAFSLRYPASWTPMGAMLGADEVFRAAAPEANGFWPNLNVVSTPGAPIPGEALITQLQSAEFAQAMAGLLNNFRVESVEVVVLDNRPSVKLVGTYNLEDGSALRLAQYYVQGETRQYVLTFTASAAAFAELEPVADRMAGSFRVVNRSGA